MWPDHRARQQRNGFARGPIRRLISPSDLGEALKPFVFLDLFDIVPSPSATLGRHPHSGIATVTLLLEGSNTYEDSTRKRGVLTEGGVEWMQAGGGVWHAGGPNDGSRMRGFHLASAPSPAQRPVSLR